MKMYYVEKKKPQVEKYHCQRNVEHNEQDIFLQKSYLLILQIRSELLNSTKA